MGDRLVVVVLEFIFVVEKDYFVENCFRKFLGVLRYIDIFFS